MQGNEANNARDMWPKGDVIGGMSPFQLQKSNTHDSDWCVKVGVILSIGERKLASALEAK